MTPAGPFRVKFTRKLPGNIAGRCIWATRTILIDAKLSRVSAWLTLWHEWVHAVLADAGVKMPKRKGYDDDPEEAVANTIALALVAEMRRR